MISIKNRERETDRESKGGKQIVQRLVDKILIFFTLKQLKSVNVTVFYC